MKIGDVCRCIKPFDGLVHGELTLYKNDIVQVHKILDKIWLEGESSGGVGKFPSNSIIETELPDHPDHLPLFVVTADFEPIQDGDLALTRGNFVVGLNSVDDAWWYGESYGRKGVFPLNFVWKIDKALIETEQKCVELYGEVLSSLKAQLPEELTLTIGDVVKVTHIIDDTWCRGECKGSTGIFPINYVKIIEKPESGDIHEVVNFRTKQEYDFNSSQLGANLTNTLNNDLTSFDENPFLDDDDFKRNFPPTFQCGPETSQDSDKNASSCLTHNFTESEKDVETTDKIQDCLSHEVDKYFERHYDVETSGWNISDLKDIDFSSISQTEESINIHPYGRAIFSFKAQYNNELSFKKGDIIHLVRHVDSHWTVGKIGDSSGIFPTSYIDIIIDCPFGEEENFTLRRTKVVKESPLETIDDQADRVNEGELCTLKPNDEGNLTVSADLSLDSISFESKENDQTCRSQDLGLSSHEEDSASILKLDPMPEESFHTYSNPSQSSDSLQKEPQPLPPPSPPPPPPEETHVPIPSKGVSRTLSIPTIKSFPEDLTTSSNQADQGSSLDPLRPPPPVPFSFEEVQKDPPLLEPDSAIITESTIEGADSSSSEVVADGNQSVSSGNTAEDTPVHDGEEANRKQLKMRRELIKELVTTEHEYIHDLESLIQVVKLSKSQKEAAFVDTKMLMGNIEDVVKFARKFLSKLHATSFEDDEWVQIGEIFIELADEMCNVYKIYSSNHSISAEQALKKYQESAGEASQYLEWILKELQQHKINLMDMRAVLIKPIQRILKYPLFIDRLLGSTPASHSDFQKLNEAKGKLLNVAKETNDYTKRLSMVSKYRHSSTQSFGGVMQRVSMHSVAKKGTRFKTRLSATIGFISQTKDLAFEEAEAKFRSTVNAATVISTQGASLLSIIKARHEAEVGIVDGFIASLHKDSRKVHVEQIKNAAHEAFSRLLIIFTQLVTARVTIPMQHLLKMTDTPLRLIQKRYDKLVDYDAAQHRLDKNQDPTRTRILEEELSVARSDYSALNMQLLTDLPIFSSEAIDIITLALKSLISMRMNLQGHLAKNYLKLAEIPAFSYPEDEDLSAHFKQKHSNMLKSLKALGFIPPEFLPRSPKERRRSSRFSREEPKQKVTQDSVSQRKSSEAADSSKYLYIVICDHKAAEPLELQLAKDAIVSVIKYKDPLGSSSRWFVDCSGRKGLVRASHLKSYNDLNLRSQTPLCPPPLSSSHQELPTESPAPTNNLPSSVSHQKPPAPTHTLPSSTPAYYSNLPPSAAAAKPDPSNEVPPKYEEIFPESRASYANEVFGEEGASAAAHAYDLPPDEKQQDAAKVESNIYEEISEFYYALYNFGGSDENQLSLYQGQVVLALLSEGNQWWLVENRDGQSGYVPASYLARYS